MKNKLSLYEEEHLRKREEKRKNTIKKFQNLQFIKGHPKRMHRILEIIEFKDKQISKKDLELILLEPPRNFENEIETGHLLNLLEYNDNSYLITPKGKEYLNTPPLKQKQFFAQLLLENDLYRDLLFNMRISKTRTMPEELVYQNFYELFSAISEKERNEVVEGLINFALYAEIIERFTSDKNSPVLHLLKPGEELYDQIVNQKRKSSRFSQNSQKPISKTQIISNTENQHTLKCFHCKKAILVDYQYCPYCSQKLQVQCEKCQKKLQADWKICPYCTTKREK